MSKLCRTRGRRRKEQQISCYNALNIAGESKSKGKEKLHATSMGGRTRGAMEIKNDKEEGGEGGLRVVDKRGE